MLASPLISVVITTYNRSEALSQVLRGLAAQTDQQFEVVIADDGSTQAHQTAIGVACRRWGIKARHVWHPDVGFTAGCARNRGVDASTADYVILLDGDCVPEVDFIARHRALRATGYFVNGSRVLLSPSLTQRVIAEHESVLGRSAAFWLQQRLRNDASKLTGLLRLPDGAFRTTEHFKWRGIRSCNMALWRKDFEAINGFDETFVGWGHEDADFVLRLHHLGLIRKNGFCSTEVFHLWHQESSRSSESVNAQKVRDRIASKQLLPTAGLRESRNGAEVRVQTLG